MQSTPSYFSMYFPLFRLHFPETLFTVHPNILDTMITFISLLLKIKRINASIKINSNNTGMLNKINLSNKYYININNRQFEWECKT